MNDSLKEQVSALMDDELRREETALLVRRLAQSPDLRAQLGRYALMGEAIRRSLPPVVDVRFAASVMERIEAEPVLKTARVRGAGQRLLKPLAGMAVAASVAALSLMVWPTGQTPGGGSAPEFAATSASVPVTGVRPVASGTTPVASGNEERDWDRLDPHIQQRLNDYLVNHSEHTTTGRFGGMLNYVRITGQSDD